MSESNNITGQFGKYECPHCHEKFETKWGTFINHMRWCKKNPKYEKILESTSKNISKSLGKLNEKKHGKYKEFEVICAECGKKFHVKEREFDFPLKENYFCSSACAHKRSYSYVQKENIAEGFRNKSEAYKEYYLQRYGKEWDDTKEFHTKYELPSIRHCEYCGKEFQPQKHETRFCSIECGKRSNYIKSIEHLLPLADNDPNKLKEIEKAYKHSCVFKFGISTYPDEFDIDLIRRVGWYKAKNHGNNLNGVSRDHKFSCKEGFRELIDPYIISHPANCKLLQHSDNISKLDKCSITIDELIDNIHKWNDKYGIYENTIDYIKFDKLGIKFNVMYS